MGDIQRCNAEIRRTLAALRDSNARVAQAVQHIAKRSALVWAGGLVLALAGVAWGRWRRRAVPVQAQNPATPTAPASSGTPRPRLAVLASLGPVALFLLQHLVLPRLPLPWRAWVGHPMVAVVLRKWLRR